MKIIILSGGISNEREVSLRSGAAINKALQCNNQDVENIDYTGDIEPAKDKILSASLVIIALHGKGGEDGTIQEELEKLGINYLGSDSKASKLCIDKWQYRLHLIQNNIEVPLGQLVDENNFWSSEFAKKPFVLKPITGGSSIDTFIIKDPEQADKQAIDNALQKYKNMIVEELISGTEITVGVLGQQPLPAVEIIPPTDGEFDYENKYNGKTQEICPPSSIDDNTHTRAMDLALNVHNICGCRHLSRTDMIITNDNKIYVIETNTIPGMTEQSLFPKEANAIGLDMPALCEKFVAMTSG